ncbi:tom1-like protein 2 [Hordeum vulgare]|nr:tom1-like protein 2 [Hordeum vulgare]
MLCHSAHSPLQELSRCDEDTQVNAMTLMGEWWNVRNKANAGKEAPKPQVVCHRVNKLLIEFLGLRNLNKPPKPPDNDRWNKPPMHSMKVNFVGAFHENTDAWGWGYVVRDQADEFYRSRIRDNQIIFESSSAILIHALKSNEYDKATIGVLMKEARS